MTLAYRRDFLKFGAAMTVGALLKVHCHLLGLGLVRPALPRGATILPSGKGPRSGLPWHSGGFGNVELFAGWRGRPFDVYTAFVSYDTWAKMLGFPANTSFPSFAKKPAWISLGYPLLPKNSDGVIVLSPELSDPLAETDPVKQTAAARLFWARHLQILDNIKNSLKTNTTYLGLVIRFGWEFNGSSSYWKLTDYTKAPQYRAVFQRLVDEARSRMPNVVVDWNPLRKGSEGAYFQDIYPGDDYVDIVSICHYDRLPSSTRSRSGTSRPSAVMCRRRRPAPTRPSTARRSRRARPRPCGTIPGASRPGPSSPATTASCSPSPSGASPTAGPIPTIAMTATIRGSSS